MKIEYLEGHQRFPCVHCGEHLCHDKGYGPTYGLCYRCARDVANQFWFVHSGEPLFQEYSPRAVDAAKKPLSAKVRWGVLRRDNYTCQECGATDRPMHVDHIIPRAKGGRNCAENLQCLCDKCNLRKGAK